MMLRITLLSGLALAALAACGDDTGGTGSGGGTGSTTGASTTTTGAATTGATTAATGATTAASTGSGDGGAGEGGSGDGGAGEGGGGTVYDCASYCADVDTACTDDLQQYPDTASCEAACEAFDTGEFQDTGNSLGCRAYHAGAALDGPDVHCGHAGPLGTGACSADATSPCEAFCQIAEEVCPDVYDSQGACEKACADFDAGDYSVGSPDEGDTLACRMYHLSVAAQGGANLELHCPHVDGVSATCPAPE